LRRGRPEGTDLPKTWGRKRTPEDKRVQALRVGIEKRERPEKKVPENQGGGSRPRESDGKTNKGAGLFGSSKKTKKTKKKQN